MKHRNNLIRVSKTIILCTFMISVLIGCNKNTIPNYQNSNTVTKDNSLVQSKQEITYDGKWKFIARPRYIKGTMVSLKQSSNGPYILNLKVELNYHSGTDPVDRSDYPFKIGEVVEFMLKDKPKINLSNNKRVIIYQCQITTDGKNDFLGADIRYYENEGKYFDMNGNVANLPPEDYPSSM